MKKFLIILFLVLLSITVIIETSLLITASVQDVSPAVQWQTWMEAIGFVKKSAEITTTARFLL